MRHRDFIKCWMAHLGDLHLTVVVMSGLMGAPVLTPLGMLIMLPIFAYLLTVIMES